VKRLNPGLILLRWKGFFEMAKAMIPEAIHRRRVMILMQDAAVDGLPYRAVKFTSKLTSYPQA
jgi:hypothetical protein